MNTSQPIAGTGRRFCGTRPDVRSLLRAADKAGAHIERRRRHFAVHHDGRIITTVPTTPSDHRSLKNARATLRRAGLAV
jgi:hypothetical protein